jgi:DNA-directed RNA polymerase specialized sigma24 family protein
MGDAEGLSNSAEFVTGPAEVACAPRQAANGHEALMSALGDATGFASLLARFRGLAQRRFGIRGSDAEDVFEEGVVTYLVVHGRYAADQNHYGLFLGILRNKCLERHDRSRRGERSLRRLGSALLRERSRATRGEDPHGDALEGLVHAEEAARIRAAIAAIPEQTRTWLLAMAEGRATRTQTIRALHLNRNTFDTRLRALRKRVRRELAAAGVLPRPAVA